MTTIVKLMGIVDLAAAYFLFASSGGQNSLVGAIMVYKGVASLF